MTTTTITIDNQNAQARLAARESVQPPYNLVPATVSYSTFGHLLIAGPEDLIRIAADQVDGMASITLLITEKVSNVDDEHLEKAMAAASKLNSYDTPVTSVKGFLGQFQIMVQAADQQQDANLAQLAQRRTHFDIILDLASSPLLDRELPPAGYFHVHQDSQKLADVLRELPDYIGEFEKPRYFHINNDICAHSGRGNIGCTRCLDVCPADAISSFKEQIEIDPHLCHGAGGCSTACPTGAISYAVPQPARMVDHLAELIKSYRDHNGQQPTILLHDQDAGRVLVERQMDKLPANLLPVQLEELAAAGLELWLSALALGASHVVLVDSASTPASMRELLQREVHTAESILAGLGFPAERISIVAESDFTADQMAALNDHLSDFVDETIGYIQSRTAKRDTLYEALDSLTATAPSYQDVINTPAHAAFGQVSINSDACTLCMSCVAVCPTGALGDGGDQRPEVNFTEQSCVQCSLCQRSCPESAIALTPRLLLDDTRREPITLHHEEPFHCIKCGEPFAPASTIEKMIEKLSEHRFYQDTAINRLKMCGDCRVKDIYVDLVADPTKQLEL